MVQVFNIEPVTMSETVTMYGVAYFRDEMTGNFKATARDQEIVVLPNVFFRALPEISRNTMTGYVEVNDAVLFDLGFWTGGSAKGERSVDVHNWTEVIQVFEDDPWNVLHIPMLPDVEIKIYEGEDAALEIGDSHYFNFKWNSEVEALFKRPLEDINARELLSFMAANAKNH